MGHPQLHARDEEGYTAFLRTCFKGDPQSIATPTEAGCDIAAKDNLGQMDLIPAIASGNRGGADARP